METAQGGRVVYADMLRVTATIAVIVLHIAGSNWANVDVTSRAWWSFNLYDGLVRWSVPIFVMLSGMFFLEQGKDISLKSLFGKSILRVAMAYVFWGIAYVVYSEALQGNELTGHTVAEALRTVARGNAHYHLWFLPMLIGLYLITPILRAFVKGATKLQLRYFLALAFVFMSVFPFLLAIRPSEALQNFVNRLQVQLVLGYVGFFIAGYYLHRFPPGKRGMAVIYALGALGLAVTIAGSYLISVHGGKASVFLYGYMTPNVIASSFAVFLLFRKLAGKITGGGRILRTLSSCSFGIYLVHDAFIMLYQRFDLTTLSFAPILSVPVLAMLVFLPSLLVSYCISKIPFFNRYIV